jgi:hypothetical protein
MAVKFENLPVADIELDRSNPRIRRFMEMYPDPTPEQVYLALGAGGDGSGEGSSFDQLKNSIFSSGGIVQPIIVNRHEGKLICVEGNTRVAIYRSFLEDHAAGEWNEIPAMVYTDLPEAEMDAIRLQVHLVGPRAWDPYSKAKYLHHLRTQELQSFDRIIDFCGGNKREVQEAIQAYSDMERNYRPLVDEGSFDITRFSGFVEYQKKKVKDAVRNHGFSVVDFARWIHERKIDPLNSVRMLPAVLSSDRAGEIFLRSGMRKAIGALDRPDLGTDLRNASLGQLARAVVECVDKLEGAELRRLQASPEDETVTQLVEALESLTWLTAQLNAGG